MQDLGQFFQRIQESAAYEKINKRLPGYLALLFTLLATYFAALITWKLLPEPTYVSPVVTQQQTVRKKQRAINYRALQIAQWSLFGKVQRVKVVKKPKKPAIDMNKVKETNIDIGLRGILYSPHPEETRAIIGRGAAKDKLFKEGARLPNGAVLEKIMKDRIIMLLNNERLAVKLKKAQKAKQLHNQLNKSPSVIQNTPNSKNPSTVKRNLVPLTRPGSK